MVGERRRGHVKARDFTCLGNPLELASHQLPITSPDRHVDKVPESSHTEPILVGDIQIIHTVALLKLLFFVNSRGYALVDAERPSPGGVC